MPPNLRVPAFAKDPEVRHAKAGGCPKGGHIRVPPNLRVPAFAKDPEVRHAKAGGCPKGGHIRVPPNLRVPAFAKDPEVRHAKAGGCTAPLLRVIPVLCLCWWVRRTLAEGDSCSERLVGAPHPC